MNLSAEQLRALMIVHALDERRWSRMGPLHHREIHKTRAEVWAQAARMVRRTFAKRGE